MGNQPRLSHRDKKVAMYDCADIFHVEYVYFLLLVLDYTLKP